VRLQAAVQHRTDNAVAKTVNPPATATVADVRAVFELAWRRRCKGITVFRDGCRGAGGQVLHLGKLPVLARGADGARAHGEFAGECRLCAV
jgi:ribonucleoside-diphosphate reductase alpha chain